MASTETPRHNPGGYRISGDRLVDAVEPIAQHAPAPPRPHKTASFAGQVAREVGNIVGWTALSIAAVLTALLAFAVTGAVGFCLWTAASIESFTTAYYLYGGGGLVLGALEITALVALFRTGRQREPEFVGTILI